MFGCGGDRDPTKRPAMGEVAARLADVVVLTSDNPRSEDPAAIIEAVSTGSSADAARPPSCVVEPDRRAPSPWRWRAAGPGDVVVIAGKGHETTQTIGDVVLPFDDREVARAGRAARACAPTRREPRVIRLLIAAGDRRSPCRWSAPGCLIELAAPAPASASRSARTARRATITKAGTPTMGGIAIVVGASSATSSAHLSERRDLHPTRASS